MCGKGAYLGQIIDCHFHDLDQPGRADVYLICTRYDLAHVAGWEPCNLRDLLIERISWVGSAQYRSYTNRLITAGSDLDDLDRDLSVRRVKRGIFYTAFRLTAISL